MRIKTAYRIARDAAIPSKDNYRAEHQFTAGWIALRFLNDPATALAHFAKVGHGNSNPITLARAGYWQGRAAEALGRRRRGARALRGGRALLHRLLRPDRARAARPQGHRRCARRRNPRRIARRLEVVRAIELLYAIDERDLIAGLAGRSRRTLDATPRRSRRSARSPPAKRTRAPCCCSARRRSGAGFRSSTMPFRPSAFPTITPIGPAIEPAVVYAIARQESTFNPRTVSSARAMGLMQVTPAAGRYVAKKFGATYDEKRLLSDQTYNVQLGAAELGDLYADYRGSHILTFAGYNAGRGRVKDWIARYGDPRDPKVDPIDWVERIPFSETRNYVQRVLENLQVYRVRFGGGAKLLIEADLRRGAAAN